MLDCCDPLDVVRAKGITLAKLNCLARCNGASSVLKYAMGMTEQEFREDVIAACSSPARRSVLVASYARPVLNQSGSGHFSPIGGYHQGRDLVLILDVARFKYPPHWVPLTTLFLAMQGIDKDSNKSRGYLMLSASPSLLRTVGEACCQLTENAVKEEEEEEASISNKKVASCNKKNDLLDHSCQYCLESSLASKNQGEVGRGEDAVASSSPPPRRLIFISLSALIRDIKKGNVTLDLLESALFFFGSKRFWIFPKNEEESQESAAQGATYLAMPEDLRSLILQKEARGEVKFLKPNVLGAPDLQVFGDYQGASSWLEAMGYLALQLDPEWWRRRADTHSISITEQVIENFTVGLHDYDSVMELLKQSDARLLPVLYWPPK